ncbi:hypothetical protein C6A85_14275, partial [Mycobacterium sp. ITM-2017-0098]
LDSTRDVAPVGRGDLVIFDLDGTLTDSAEGIVASFRHALHAVAEAHLLQREVHGGPDDPADQVAVGDGRADSV